MNNNDYITQTPAQQRKAAKRQKHGKVYVHRRNKIAVICACVLLITLIVNIPFLRSKTSVTEKRNLAQFPKFTFSALTSGSYFSDISLWFSDTVPARDTLTSANMALKNLLGINGAQAGFNEGKAGDSIPVPGRVIEDETDAPATAPPVTDAQPVQEITTEVTTAPATTEEDFTGVSEALGSVAIVDNAGYEYYNFVQSTADNYIRAINRSGNSLAGKTNVYCMIIPLSSDITLNSKVRAKLSVSDQRDATDYMYGSMNSNVKTVEVFNPLKEHKNEYIYFRTDHHWTALGAYYAYLEYCTAAGLYPVRLENCKLQSFDGFLGTFYNDSGQSPALAATPDVVDTYYPPCEVSMTVTDRNGATYALPLIYDESGSSTASVKYSAFISGDNPFSVITNASEHVSDVCVVVKESFGNALVPFLVPNYKTIYVIDYRYWSGDITSFCIEHGAKDLLFCNNISMTRSSSNVDALSSKIS